MVINVKQGVWKQVFYGRGIKEKYLAKFQKERGTCPST